ncbi:MAG: HEAT repeat domain-containing protein, partial [Gemmatimonadales bacterium]
MRGCSRRRIPCGSSAVLVLLAVLAPARAEPQQVTEALVGDLARLLAAADARRFDAPLFHETLRHPEPAVRRQAALAAGRIGDPGAVELLIAALEDSSDQVQIAAAFALGLLKDARALPALVGVIRARSADPVAVEAVTAIAKVGGDDAAWVLRDMVASAAPTDVRVGPAVGQAVLESWRLGTRAPVAALLTFAQAADAAVRWRAVYALARLRAPAGASALLAALGDP